MISWQGFKQEDDKIGFGAMKQQSYSMMRLHQAELTILIRGAKGREICQQGKLVQILLGSITTTKTHHKEDSMVSYKITSRCIDFGSSIVSRYAQSNSMASKQEKSDNDVNSALSVSSNQ
jgi:hypothetical protein